MSFYCANNNTSSKMISRFYLSSQNYTDIFLKLQNLQKKITPCECVSFVICLQTRDAGGWSHSSPQLIHFTCRPRNGHGDHVDLS